MMKTLFLLLVLQESPLEETADAIAKSVAAEPGDVARLCDDSFLREVPPEKLVALCKELHAKNGTVKSVMLVARNSAFSGKFLFTFEKGTRSRVTLAVNGEGRVVGLHFASPGKAYASFEEGIADLRKLPGTVTFRFARLGEKVEPLAEFNPDLPVAIGSSFKLYILGALVEDHRPWDEVLTLREEWRSLPSGILHTWPVGAPVTVHTLASQMISISDNTATDHLLHHMGRERVEGMLKAMGNEHAKRSVPFLGTLEMFQLKSDAELTKRYLAADEKGRRELLNGDVKSMPRDRVTGWAKPTAIDRLEWFASAGDLCRAMDWYRRKNEATALGVLAINPGLEAPKERFPYVGYKGGSEPGVLNLTFLLRARDGSWYALSAGWNNPEKALDEKRFFGLVQALLDLAAK